MVCRRAAAKPLGRSKALRFGSIPRGLHGCLGDRIHVGLGNLRLISPPASVAVYGSETRRENPPLSPPGLRLGGDAAAAGSSAESVSFGLRLLRCGSPRNCRWVELGCK